jgi:DNA-binding GntR family transcriptional regulator
MARREIVRGIREQIAGHLRDDVLSGRLVEGQRLCEAQLAQRFGVSRGPIREALVQLAHEGLLDAKPNCGVKVASSAPNSVRELVIPIRRTIETFALRLVFQELGPEDFDRWDALLERMKLACLERDLPAIVETDIAFHRVLLERAGQPDILAIWATIVARIRAHFSQVQRAQKGQPMDVYGNHRTLVEAFQTRDEETAVKALEAHIW